jgi:DUF1009 family protein
MASLPKLGVIAGGGSLPLLVRQAAAREGRACYIAALTGFCDSATVEGADHGWFDLAKVGKLFSSLEKAGVKEILLCGSLKKPNFQQLMPDWEGAKLLPKIVAAAGKGDDALLRVVLEAFEKRDFRIRALQDMLPELLCPEGTLGAIAPRPEQEPAIAAALKAARDLGGLDKGQAAVATADAVIGLEDDSGTDALLQRLGNEPRAKGAVLGKCAKPQQDRRADLPTIGPETLRRAAQAGLAGIALGAGGTLIVERAACIALADAAGMFLVGRSQ